MKKTALATVAAAAMLGASLITATPASAAPSAPDSQCMRAGMATLRSVGLLDDVARGGLPISVAVGYGVSVRPGSDISGVPNPIPLKIVLADHRAGDNSLFMYPWCS